MYRSPRRPSPCAASCPALTVALCDTSPEALCPTLVELRDQFNQSLSDAEVPANDLLDEWIAKTTERKVIWVLSVSVNS